MLHHLSIVFQSTENLRDAFSVPFHAFESYPQVHGEFPSTSSLEIQISLSTSHTQLPQSTGYIKAMPIDSDASYFHIGLNFT